MTCTCNFLSPFLWALHPCESQFLQDEKFFKGASTGKTMGVIQTAAVTRFEQEHGRNPGSIFGISAKADRLAEAGRTRRKRSGGHYVKRA